MGMFKFIMKLSLIILLTFVMAYNTEEVVVLGDPDVEDTFPVNDEKEVKYGALSEKDIAQLTEIVKMNDREGFTAAPTAKEVVGVIKYGGCKYYCNICECGWNISCLIKQIYCMLNKLRSVLNCLVGLNCYQKRYILYHMVNQYLAGCHWHLRMVLRGVFWNIIRHWC